MFKKKGQKKMERTPGFVKVEKQKKPEVKPSKIVEPDSVPVEMRPGLKPSTPPAPPKSTPSQGDEK